MPIPLQYCTVVSGAKRQNEEIKNTQIGKDKLKLSLFADDMLHVRAPKRICNTTTVRKAQGTWFKRGQKNCMSQSL